MEIFFFHGKLFRCSKLKEKQHDLKMYAKRIHSLTLLSLPKKSAFVSTKPSGTEHSRP